jgi:DNA modification methylase
MEKEAEIYIRTIVLDDYQPLPDNARVDLEVDDPDYQRISSSHDEFGVLDLITVNKRTRHIISGHQRCKVFKAKGIKKIKAIVVDFDETRECAAALAVNKAVGRWDMPKLAKVLAGLCEIPNFDITSTGFDLSEVTRMLDEYVHNVNEEQAADEDRRDKPSITKKGDVIFLGENKVMCGDSTDPNDLRILMGDEVADMEHGDPSYDVSYNGSRPTVPGNQKNKKPKWEVIINDDLGTQKYEEFFSRFLQAVDTYIKPGAPVYLWNARKNFWLMANLLKKLGYRVSNDIIWAKPHAALTFGDYSESVEHCLYAWKPAKSGRHKWYGRRGQSNLWEIGRENPQTYLHANQKPLELIARIIKNSSKRGDLILEPFLGSGTTLIAAQSLDRKCYGLELDEYYCDKIVRRYIQRFGKLSVSSEVYNKYNNGGVNG